MTEGAILFSNLWTLFSCSKKMPLRKGEKIMLTENVQNYVSTPWQELNIPGSMSNSAIALWRRCPIRRIIILIWPIHLPKSCSSLVGKNKQFSFTRSEKWNRRPTNHNSAHWHSSPSKRGPRFECWWCCRFHTSFKNKNHTIGVIISFGIMKEEGRVVGACLRLEWSFWNLCPPQIWLVGSPIHQPYQVFKVDHQVLISKTLKSKYQINDPTKNVMASILRRCS